MNKACRITQGTADIGTILSALTRLLAEIPESQNFPWGEQRLDALCLSVSPVKEGHMTAPPHRQRGHHSPARHHGHGLNRAISKEGNISVQQVGVGIGGDAVQAHFVVQVRAGGAA